VIKILSNVDFHVVYIVKHAFDFKFMGPVV
jgi:hypothetical protein